LEYYAISNRSVKEVYANESVRTLHMLSKGKLDKHKAVHSEGVSPKGVHTGSILPGTGAIAETSSSPPISLASYKSLFHEIRRKFGESKQLFINDGYLGSRREIAVKARLITNHANTALLFKHFLFPAPARTTLDTMRDWEEDLKIFVIPNFVSPNLGNYGITKSAFSIINYMHNQIVVGGGNAPSALHEAVGTLAALNMQHFRSGSVVLRGHSYLSHDKKKSVLVFHDEKELEYNNNNNDELFAGHDTVWNSEGIFALWNGVAFENNENNNTILKRGDLVFHFGKKSIAYSSLNSNLNMSKGPAPSAIIFLKKSETADKITATEFNKDVESRLHKYFHTGTNTDLQDTLHHLCEKNKPKIFDVQLKSQNNLKQLINDVITQNN